MLENTFPNLGGEDLAPLCIHDHNVIVWKIYKFVKENWHSPKSGGKYEAYVRGLYCMVINRGPDMIPMYNYRHIILRDQKDDNGFYWRGVMRLSDPRMDSAWESYAASKKINLETLDTGYKGGRGEKEDDWLVLESICREYAESFFPVYVHPGFEADDFAGAVKRICSKRNTISFKRYVFLHTIDRDWSQLVDENSKIYWANTRYNRPNEYIQSRLAGDEEVALHTLYKTGEIISHPSELLAVKGVSGDLGDTLPPGTPLEYFELEKAHPIFNVDKLSVIKALRKDCRNPVGNSRIDHFLNCLEVFKGMKLPFLTSL